MTANQILRYQKRCRHKAVMLCRKGFKKHRNEPFGFGPWCDGFDEYRYWSVVADHLFDAYTAAIDAEIAAITSKW